MRDATWSSATRMSCSTAMRSAGSMLGSLCPSLAIVWASWRPCVAAGGLALQQLHEVGHERQTSEHVVGGLPSLMTAS